MSRKHSLKGKRRPRIPLLAMSFIVICGLAVTVASPALLQQITRGTYLDWLRLSYIGQTYGAASALLSALALTGVSASLVLQAKESHAARKDTGRNHHLRLMEMAINDRGLLECWGNLGSPGWPHDPRQRLYLNLIVSYWEMMYEVGEEPVERLRVNLRSVLFSGRLGYDFWAETRLSRLLAADNRSKRLFWQLVEEEYEEAGRIAPPSSTTSSHAAAGLIKRSAPMLLTCAGAVTAGALGSLLARRRRARA